MAIDAARRAEYAERINRDIREAMRAAESSLANARRDRLDEATIELFESVVARYKTLIKQAEDADKDREAP